MSKSIITINGICIYKKIKLTRNINSERFTAAMTTDQSIQVRHFIESKIPYLQAFKKYELASVNLENRLEQQRYLSEGVFYVDPLKSNLAVGLMISRDERFYLCINDLDHIRMNLTSYDESFDELWQNLDLLDDGLGQVMDIAYLEPFGYLTSKIEQLGTALNGEALMHLPALKRTGFINAITESMGAIGVQIKPYRSDFYIVFNTVTLGRSEIELALLLDQVVEKLSERELAGRETIWVSDSLKLKDQIGRAFGQCQFSAAVEEDEALEWISLLMLGERLGLVESEGSTQESLYKWHDYLLRVSDIRIEKEKHKSLGYREKMQRRGEILNEIHTRWHWRGDENVNI